MRLVIDLQGFQSIGSRMRGIGRYSLSLAQAMARTPRGHDLVVAMNDAIPDILETGRSLFEPLLPRENIVVWSSLEAADALYAGQAWRRRTSELLFEDAMARLRPDIVHISSLFEGWSGNVVSSIGLMPEHYASAVTLYDLIPMQAPETYLADPVLRAWYEGRIRHLKRAHLFLAISEHSRQEGIELLGLQAQQVFNISGSCSDLFEPVTLGASERYAFNAKYGINKPYLLYTGGFDSRKNVPALIRAFAGLPDGIRASHQLVVAGYAPPNELSELLSLRAASGLRPEECLFTGYVSDEDLLVLYSQCRLYVFPSLREGFGLPILEAMACGAVVIGSDRTSLPEVIGLQEAMFNPDQLEDMQRHIQRGLTDQDFRDRLQRHAAVQARRFSWEECASRAWDAFEYEYARRQSSSGSHVFMSLESDRTEVRRNRSVAVFSGDGPSAALVDAVREAWSGDDLGIDVVDWSALDTVTPTRRRALPRELEQYDEVILVVDDEESLQQAARVLQVRRAQLMIVATTLQALCLGILEADASRSSWIKGIVLDAGRPWLLTDPAAQEKTGQLVEDWICEAASSVNEFLDAELPARFEAPWRGIGECHDDPEQRGVAMRIVTIEPAPGLEEADWRHVARAMAWNRRLGEMATRRLMIDITELAKGDAGSGIQRVVRNIVRHLALDGECGFAVHPVYLDARGVFRHARAATLQLTGLAGDAGITDAPVEWRPGDTFLGLDLSADALLHHPRVFEWMKYRGITLYFVIYDLIPLLRPDCVDKDAVPVFQHWYRSIAPLADGLICISRAVADELARWLDQEKPARKRPLPIGYFHLGADLEGAASQAIAEDALPPELEGARFVLMVGTLEPRKGYAQALDAFERVWREGGEESLVIVGKKGWMVDELALRIQGHAEHGRRLHWYQHARDEVLQALYSRADFLLCASEAEGFGLPLIEAAQHGLAVLARDIPVFREVAGDSAYYFDGRDAADLSNAIAIRLADATAAGSIVMRPSWITWAESARQLVAVVRDGAWYARHVDSGRRWFYATDARLGTPAGTLVAGSIQSTGKPGLLTVGPRVAVERGRYTLRLHGRIERQGRLDVLIVSEKGQVTLLKRQVDVARAADGIMCQTNFELVRSVSDLEIRIHIDGALRIEIVALELIPGITATRTAPIVPSESGRRPAVRIRQEESNR